MKKILSLLLSVMMLLSALAPLEAMAADYGLTVNNGVIGITPEQLMQYDPATVIERALKMAKENASYEAPITITVPSGNYALSKCLHIYSNTNLVLQPDTVLKRSKTENYNLLKAGLQDEINTGYSGYENIGIYGGVWDCAFKGTSCGMRFAHCRNVTLQNVSILNNYNSHHMELAAADGFNIIGCFFSGYKRTGSGDGEAIQIDVLHNATHFPSYEKFDDTPCRNVTVSGCTFDNVYAGVGTRSGVIGSYFENIRIAGNIFRNVADKAVCAFNYLNSVIDSNYIENATIGVIFEHFPASNLTGKLYMPNSKTASTAIINNLNCVISNNTISVKNNTGRENSSGIAVYGGRLSAAQAKNYGLQQGNYDIGALSIYNNSISSQLKSSGILLNYVHNSYIGNNSVVAASQETNGKIGLQLYESTNNTITANHFTRYFNGVQLTSNSLKNKLSYNTISSSYNFAYFADENSGGTVYNTNKYKNNRTGRFYIGGKTYTDAKVKGVKVSKNKKKKTNTLTWKRNTKAKGYEIYRATKQKGTYNLVKTVKNNKTVKFVNKKINKKKHYYYKVVAYKKIKHTKIYSKSSKIVHT